MTPRPPIGLWTKWDWLMFKAEALALALRKKDGDKHD